MINTEEHYKKFGRIKSKLILTYLTIMFNSWKNYNDMNNMKL